LPELSPLVKSFPTHTSLPGTPERVETYRVRAKRGASVTCDSDAKCFADLQGE
jgi:hypothetical protein